MEATSGTDELVISTDGSTTSAGAFVVQTGSTGFAGIYDNANSLYYGISRTLPAPSGTAVLGGYFHGMGIGAASNGSGNPAFGVLTSTQSGSGKGNVALTVTDTNVIQSFNSTLDDGSGNMALAGGLSRAIRTVTTSPAISATDSVVLLNAATLTATLPTAVGIAGREYTVKLIASSTATLATTSSQTIDGATTKSLTAQYKYITVVSDGANWQIVANN